MSESASKAVDRAIAAARRRSVADLVASAQPLVDRARRAVAERERAIDDAWEERRAEGFATDPMPVPPAADLSEAASP